VKISKKLTFFLAYFEKVQMSVHGAIYLIQPVEFLKTNTYKIGMSYGDEQRPSTYGENTNIISFHQVNNPQKVEKLLKNVFDLNFKKTGEDFYSGSIQLMKKMFIQEVINYELFNYIEKENYPKTNTKKSTAQNTKSKRISNTQRRIEKIPEEDELDDVQQFIAACCELGGGFEEKVCVLHPAYVEWVTNNIGNKHHQISAFGGRLMDLKFKKKRSQARTVYEGLRLKIKPKTVKTSKPSNFEIPGEHKQSSKKRPTCKNCGNSFSDQSGVNKHMKRQVCTK
jgi:hypothetical protein